MDKIKSARFFRLKLIVGNGKMTRSVSALRGKSRFFNRENRDFPLNADALKNVREPMINSNPKDRNTKDRILSGKTTLGDISELFERNETGRVGSADTGATMLDWLVGDRELAQVMTNHLGFDFNLVECFALVDSDDASDHLGHDDHVPQVRLHGLGLLVGKTSLLRLTQLLDETHRLAFETTSELAANAAREQLHQLVGRHVQQLVKVYSSVSVFPEGSLFGLNIRHFTCLLRLRLDKYKILNKLKLLNYKLPPCTLR